MAMPPTRLGRSLTSWETLAASATSNQGKRVLYVVAMAAGRKVPEVGVLSSRGLVSSLPPMVP